MFCTKEGHSDYIMETKTSPNQVIVSHVVKGEGKMFDLKSRLGLLRYLQPVISVTLSYTEWEFLSAPSSSSKRPRRESRAFTICKEYCYTL